MKPLITTLILAVLINYSSYCQQGPKNFIDQPYIEVTGKAETEIIPNEIYLKIILNENDSKGKVSIETQEQQLLSVLKTLGVDIEDHLSVEDFDGYYKRRFLSDNDLMKIKVYELLVCDGKTLNAVYYQLDKIDVSNISIARVSHSDIVNLRRETKLKALKEAKEKALEYAMAIDQSIGNALFIQESNNNDLPSNALHGANILTTGYGREKIREAQFPSLQISKIIISETVLAKFILK